MFLGEWNIDETLYWWINSHDPSSGAAVDADSAPTWRLYENEDATPIQTGTMTLGDSSNTDGFYYDSVVLSSANGFNSGNIYTIRMEITVDSVVGAPLYTFQVI